MFTIETNLDRHMYRVSAKLFISYFHLYSNELYTIRVMSAYRSCLDNLNDNRRKGAITPHCYCIMYDIFDTLVQQFFTKERNFHYIPKNTLCI